MQTQKNVRWDDMRVLLALFRAGSLKRGAEALGINISTVSRRLDALEDATGAHLFDRTPEGVHPTAAAKLLLPFAETMEGAAHAFGRELDALDAQPEGEVRIAAPPGLAEHFIAPALVELRRLHPAVTVTLASAVGYADLTRNEADIALRSVRPASGDFVAARVNVQPYCVLASPKNAAAWAPLRDVDAVPWITWAEDLMHLPDRRWLDANVDRSAIVLWTSSMTAQMEAVRAGLGAVLAPLPFAQLRGLSDVRCSPKIRRSIAEIPSGELWIVGHRAYRNVPRIAVVWEWLQARMTSP